MDLVELLFLYLSNTTDEKDKKTISATLSSSIDKQRQSLTSTLPSVLDDAPLTPCPAPSAVPKPINHLSFSSFSAAIAISSSSLTLLSSSLRNRLLAA